MQYTVKIVNELGTNIVYIKELNNSYSTDVIFEKDEYHFSDKEIIGFIKNTNSKNATKFIELISRRNELKNEDNHNKEWWGPRYNLCFHLSRKCNLSCKYCFGMEEHLPQEISFDTIKKCIDYFIYDYGKNACQYIIDLSGSGEPLLRFELIKQIEEYVDSIRDELGKDIMIMFCTNATLINEEKAEYLKSKSRILLGVSIDGNKIQNANRIYKNNNEVYEDVLRGIKMLNPKPLGLAVTVTNKNEDVDVIFDTLSRIENSDCVSIQNVRNFTNNEFSFYNINIDNLFYHYEILLTNMIKHISQGDYLYFLKMLRGSDYLGKFINRVLASGTLFQYRCDGGKNRLVADEKGNFYSCSVMNGCEQFKFGSLDQGINQQKVKSHIYAVDKTPNNCPNCWAGYICSGECNAISYYTHGDLYTNNEQYCKFKKRLIRLAISFVNKLRIDLPEHYKNIMKYFIETSNYMYSDIGIWAVCNMFKMNNISYKYSSVSCEINRTYRGISPQEILRYINSKTIDHYILCKIDVEDESVKLDGPAIAINSKNASILYSYCVIIEQCDDKYKVQFMNRKEYVYISKSDFIQKFSEYIITKK